MPTEPAPGVVILARATLLHNRLQMSSASTLPECVRALSALGDSICELNKAFSTNEAIVRRVDEFCRTTFLKEWRSNVERYERFVDQSNVAAIELSVATSTFVTLVSKKPEVNPKGASGDLARELESLHTGLSRRAFDPNRELLAIRRSFRVMGGKISASATKRETALRRRATEAPIRPGRGAQKGTRPAPSFLVLLLGCFGGGRVNPAPGLPQQGVTKTQRTYETSRTALIKTLPTKGETQQQESLDLKELNRGIQDIESKLESQSRLFSECFRIRDELKKTLSNLNTDLKQNTTNMTMGTTSTLGAGKGTNQAVSSWEQAGKALETYAKRMKYA